MVLCHSFFSYFPFAFDTSNIEARYFLDIWWGSISVEYAWVFTFMYNVYTYVIEVFYFVIDVYNSLLNF